VAVVGRPNVGKSTLLNAALKQRIASVSPWPQTTRKRQLGILTTPEAQIVFMDTPGLHQPKNKLGKAMLRIAEETIQEADVILFMADLAEPPGEEDRTLAAWTLKASAHAPMILALNKQDSVASGVRESRVAEYRAMLPRATPFMVSAERGEGLRELFAELVAWLPEGPDLYPEEEITDLTERDLAADLIHEAALRHLRDEVPHGVAVRVDEYEERAETGARIAATLFVERESHKPIVIGKGGAMLKTIGSDARLRIEEMSGRKIYLELRVKVLPHWRNNEHALRRLGFQPPED
jgi:GTP-binding protein Era